MNKEIRFMVFDKETKTSQLVTLQDLVEGRFYCSPDFPAWKDKLVFRRNTNLHDKNGKEIWEGDIVGDKGVGPRYEIKFVSGSYVMNHINGRTEFVLYGRQDIVEVLGNIYEHPHLLGEKK